MKDFKAITLTSGREEEYMWGLRISVGPRTRMFNGYFVFYKRDKEKKNIQTKDQMFFKKRLRKEMYDTYEIHHDWKNGGRTTLLTPKEHRNSCFSKANLNPQDWIRYEEWLEEL